MAKGAKEKLIVLLDRLIAQASGLLGRDNYYSRHVTDLQPAVWVDSQPLAQLRSECRNLVRVLGRQGDVWKKTFDNDGTGLDVLKEMLGTLQGIRTVVENDLLVTVEDLIFAEAFADLLEQAEHLLEGGYFLAAGVLGRAVLEEHLRKWCDHAGCVPAGAKPTLSSFQVELQKAGHLTKLEVAHVSAMASTGNTAAHNLPGLTHAAVERLIRDVGDFLVRHPLS